MSEALMKIADELAAVIGDTINEIVFADLVDEIGRSRGIFF